MDCRIEKDLIGELSIDNCKYWGINTQRALENFGDSFRKVHLEYISSISLIKKCAALTNIEFGFIDKKKGESIVFACDEIISGKFADEFPLPAVQGGAGTSINMNVNEVVANIALENMGFDKGRYDIICPNDDVNKFQSTNDVYPTAVKLACIKEILDLSYKLADLQNAFQNKEKEFADILKCGRTQLQDAMPITLGQEFGAYAQAIQRDRWRIYKCEERLRQVNLGGTAIGTGTGAPKGFIFKFIEKVRELSKIGLARSENTIDITQNADAFVEVSAILKTVAVNFIKISSDLRLLSSGPFTGIGEIRLPVRQAGSSIMPGKVNPVIAEFAGMCGMQVIANDTAVTYAASSGQLELNVWLPLIACNLMDSIKLLSQAAYSWRINCIEDITAVPTRCEELLDNSFAFVTLIVPYIGYKKATELVEFCLENSFSVRQGILEKGYFSDEELDVIFNPRRATSAGIPGADKFKDRIVIKS